MNVAATHPVSDERDSWGSNEFREVVKSVRGMAWAVALLHGGGARFGTRRRERALSEFRAFQLSV